MWRWLNAQCDSTSALLQLCECVMTWSYVKIQGVRLLRSQVLWDVAFVFSPTEMLDPEHEITVYLRNVGKCSPKDTASHLSKTLNVLELSLPSTEYDVVCVCVCVWIPAVHCMYIMLAEDNLSQVTSVPVRYYRFLCRALLLTSSEYEQEKLSAVLRSVSYVSCWCHSEAFPSATSQAIGRA